MKEILFVIWFFLPAGLANSSPIYATRIPILKKLDTPIDFNIKLGGNILFGKNKTWRGLILAIIVGMLVAIIEHIVYANSASVRSMSTLINYQQINYLLLGGLLGAGAIIGDVIESFIKRRLGIKPGNSWFPYDQIDYIIGGCFLSLFVVHLRFVDYLGILVIWFLLHIVFSYLGYLIGWKQKPI